MSFKIEIVSGFQKTPGGTYWSDIATVSTLRATLNGKPVEAKWSVSDGGMITPLQEPEEKVLLVVDPFEWMFMVTGFGMPTITATPLQGGEKPATLTVGLGSVIIASPDGIFWQIYPDGSSSKMDPGTLSDDVKRLVEDNAIIADLTGRSQPTAVTCYLLNLKSFMPKPPHQPEPR